MGILMPLGGRHRPPIAPISVSRQADDDEWGESSSEWSSGGESDAGSSWGTDEEQTGSAWSSGESGGGYGGGEASGAEAGGGDVGGGETGSGGSAGSVWSGGESSGAGAGGGETGGESGSGWESGESDQGSAEDSGSTWWPFGGHEEEGEEEDGGHSQDDMDRKTAEGETGTESDVYVPTGGGPPPEGFTVNGTSGFQDGGPSGTVAFGDEPSNGADSDEALRPHAFAAGGRAGSIAWAGGGKAGGPKGNQESGSLDPDEVVPEYDSTGNGPFSNADAWVRAGTGVVNVHRSYVTSNAGDQGNGWWISAAAAGALEAHEQRHVASSKSLYESNIQPALDRIAVSATTGKDKTYWQSDARALLKRQIGWEGALRNFKDEDMAYNGKWGQIDSQDYGSSGYPRNQKGPRKIQGKDYDNFLIMGSEPDPT